MNQIYDRSRLLIADLRCWNRSVLIILLILSIMCLSSCISISKSRSSITVGKALNEDLIENIEINKTTMSEILKWFGAPHNIVHGKGYEVEAPLIARGEINPTGYDASAVMWYRERSLDSIYENWIMFIYKFQASYAKKDAYGVTILPVTVRDSEDDTTLGKDELVIFIDDKTQLVENYGFRKEIGD